MLLAPHLQYTATFIPLKHPTRAVKLPYHQQCLAFLLENCLRLRGILQSWVLATRDGAHRRRSNLTLETYLALRRALW